MIMHNTQEIVRSSCHCGVTRLQDSNTMLVDKGKEEINLRKQENQEEAVDGSCAGDENWASIKNQAGGRREPGVEAGVENRAGRCLELGRRALRTGQAGIKN